MLPIQDDLVRLYVELALEPASHDMVRDFDIFHKDSIPAPSTAGEVDSGTDGGCTDENRWDDSHPPKTRHLVAAPGDVLRVCIRCLTASQCMNAAREGEYVRRMDLGPYLPLSHPPPPHAQADSQGCTVRPAHCRRPRPLPRFSAAAEQVLVQHPRTSHVTSLFHRNRQRRPRSQRLRIIRALRRLTTIRHRSEQSIGLLPSPQLETQQIRHPPTRIQHLRHLRRAVARYSRCHQLRRGREAGGGLGDDGRGDGGLHDRARPGARGHNGCGGGGGEVGAGDGLGVERKTCRSMA